MSATASCHSENKSDQEDTNFPYYAHEILDNLEEFKAAERHYRGNDSYVPLLYKGKRCQIQTPNIMVMFGLTKYHINGEQDIKYSLHLSLKHTDVEMKQFSDFMYSLDEFAKEYFLPQYPRFWSSIRDSQHENKNHSPVLRVKINTNQDKLLIDCIDLEGNQICTPTEEEFKRLVTHRTIVKAIIEVNPLWYAGNKYGISYRLLKLMIVENPKQPVHFRD